MSAIQTSPTTRPQDIELDNLQAEMRDLRAEVARSREDKTSLSAQVASLTHQLHNKGNSVSPNRAGEAGGVVH